MQSNEVLMIESRSKDMLDENAKRNMIKQQSMILQSNIKPSRAELFEKKRHSSYDADLTNHN